jgi:hypothetical protein
MQINMTTFARRERHYIHRTLQSLFETSEDSDLSVALIIGSEDESHVQEYVNHPAIRIIPWDMESIPNLRWNCTLNKIRALRYGDEDCALICEDDIKFKPGWFSKLCAAANEMGDEEYILTISRALEDGEPVRLLSGKRLVRQYPNFVLMGAQALYYPTKTLRSKVADYLTKNLKGGCGDDLIGRYARSFADLYCTTDQLVTHIGGISCFPVGEDGVL